MHGNLCFQYRAGKGKVQQTPGHSGIKHCSSSLGCFCLFHTRNILVLLDVGFVLEATADVGAITVCRSFFVILSCLFFAACILPVCVY